MLRSREEMHISRASGILIERQLRSLSLRAGCRHEVHYGAASRTDHSFDTTSKRELFRLLYEIEESCDGLVSVSAEPSISMIGCEGIES